jgi:hypothetical protein
MSDSTTATPVVPPATSSRPATSEVVRGQSQAWSVLYRLCVLVLLTMAVIKLWLPGEAPASSEVMLADVDPGRAARLGAWGKVPVVYVTNMPDIPMKGSFDRIDRGIPVKIVNADHETVPVSIDGPAPRR